MQMLLAMLGMLSGANDKANDLSLNFGYSYPNSIIGIGYHKDDYSANIGLKEFNFSTAGYRTFSPGLSLGWTIPSTTTTFWLTGTLHYFSSDNDYLGISYAQTFGNAPSMEIGWNPGDVGLSASYRLGKRWGLNLDGGASVPMQDPTAGLMVHVGISGDFRIKL